MVLSPGRKMLVSNSFFKKNKQPFIITLGLNYHDEVSITTWKW